jgi:hypothetical protein
MMIQEEMLRVFAVFFKNPAGKYRPTYLFFGKNRTWCLELGLNKAGLAAGSSRTHSCGSV